MSRRRRDRSATVAALADMLGPFVRAARNAFSSNTERAAEVRSGDLRRVVRRARGDIERKYMPGPSKTDGGSRLERRPREHSHRDADRPGRRYSRNVRSTVFTAPSNTTLAANTTYYVEAGQTDGTGGLPDHVTTSSNAEDSGASSRRWSIGNGRYRRDNETDSWSSRNSSAQFFNCIAINGFAVNSAGDYTPPALRTSDPPVVRVRPNTSTELVIKFNEALDRTNLPPADAFTVTVSRRLAIRTRLPGESLSITGHLQVGGPDLLSAHQAGPDGHGGL